MDELNPSGSDEQPPGYEFATSHRHIILATAPEADHDRPVPVTLHHWCPPAVSARITVVMSPDSLAAIKDFKSLGTFSVPDNVRFELSRPLSEHFPAAGTPEGQEPTPDMLTGLMSHSGISDVESRVRLFSFPVFSGSPTEIFSDGLLPIWKWVKPSSVYNRKCGRWEPTIQKALEDGEWNAGKDLDLLVRIVSEEMMERVKAGGVKYVNFGAVEGSAVG